ncbi:VOC family protein [Amnibacterium sp. CER49]|uniref:VOC family protein n=1 Tax=Amnibacterium sp. CER49 TaxID=3039161 RepID=UPI00244BD1E9|nr:VOC family protein [Amnibacterium sp. CER49]MDH2442506.1 VOC family protein [Amnibacterium sp. CER49]
MAVSKVGNVTVHAVDPQRLAAFWAAALGYAERRFEGELKQQLLAGGLTEGELAKRGLAEDPAGAGPRLLFQHADRPKSPGERNRMHLDVSATPGRPPSRDELDAEKDRLVALGAEVVRLVDQRWGPFEERYYQLRDPEGNEFCLQ